MICAHSHTPQPQTLTLGRGAAEGADGHGDLHEHRVGRHLHDCRSLCIPSLSASSLFSCLCSLLGSIFSLLCPLRDCNFVSVCMHSDVIPFLTTTMTNNLNITPKLTVFIVYIYPYNYMSNVPSYHLLRSVS